MLIFAKTNNATPVLNTPHFRRIFSTPLPLCDQGLLRAIELVALPNTPLTITEWLGDHICRVLVPGYPGDALFVDRRFLTLSKKPFHTQKPPLPSKDELINRMHRRVGAPYIWGGNWGEGVPELLTLYPPQTTLDPKTQTQYCLKGVDCTGLLYEAANGQIPRNTSDLYTFGTALPIAKLSPKEIASFLAPLDFLVWKNHFIIVIEGGQSIESHKDHGVFIANLEERLSELMQTLTPTNDTLYTKQHLSARRWHPYTN